jgi:hypothetical protein
MNNGVVAGSAASARALLSAALAISFSSSRSHSTAAPATNTPPSSA